MTVTIHPVPDQDEIASVTRRMRDVDRREIFATRWTDDPDDLASDLARLNEMSWSARLDGVPAGIWGASPIWPRVWVVFAFGTDDWPHVVLSMTKHIRRFIVPAIVRANAIRVSCASHAQHTEAHRWLTSLGATLEAEHPNMGKGGERFFTFVWNPATVAETLAQPRRQRGCASAAAPA